MVIILNIVLSGLNKIVVIFNHSGANKIKAIPNFPF